MAGKRRDTTLEAEGAEFLVLGHLLTLGIPAYKAYNRNAGHDLVAVNPDVNASARIEVKSRWASDAHWNMGTKAVGATDFYVYVRLNQGSGYQGRAAEIRAPEFYILPEDIAQALPKTGWQQARLNKLPDIAFYRERWDLIRDFLALPHQA